MATSVDNEATVREGRRAPFKQLPDAVMDDDTLSNEAKLTYWYLKRIAGYADGRAKVSVGRLAEKLHCSRSSKRSARGWIGELVSRGWLDVVHHTRRTPDGKTQHLVSEYVVHATAEPPTAEPPTAEPLTAADSEPQEVGAGEPPCSRKVSTEEVPLLDSEDSASAASPRSGDGRHAQLEDHDEDRGYPREWDEQDAAREAMQDACDVRTERLLARLEADPDIDWFEGCEETMARSILDRGKPYEYVKNKILKDRRLAPVF